MDLMTLLRSQWDRVASGACVLLGLVLLVLGYEGVASSAYVAQELAYLVSGGLGGLFFLAVGSTLYISADMHDEWRKLDRIEDAIRSLQPQDPPGGRRAELVEDSVEVEVLLAKPAGKRRLAAQVAPGTARVDGGVTLRQTADFFEYGAPSLAAALRTPPAVIDSLRVSAATMTVGGLGLALAYTRVANVAGAEPAIMATAFAVVALVVVGLGSVLGTLGLRRRLMLRRGALLYPFLQQHGWCASAAIATAPLAATGDLLRMIAGGTYAHEPSCAMVRGEPSTAVARDALPEGVRLCALCGSS